MDMSFKFSGVVLAAALTLAGCAQGAGTGGTRLGDACGNLGWGKLGGAAIGGALGGLAGNQIGRGSGNALATAIGAGAGLLLGGAAGSRIDDVDCMKAQQAQTAALSPSTPIGQQIQWNDEKTGNYGSFTPTRDGKSATGQYCREYQQTIVIGGEAKQGHGTACREPDGSWKIVSE
jgi:surface antigen